MYVYMYICEIAEFYLLQLFNYILVEYLFFIKPSVFNDRMNNVKMHFENCMITLVLCTVMDVV